jgi:hypothetical protein
MLTGRLFTETKTKRVLYKRNRTDDKRKGGSGCLTQSILCKEQEPAWNLNKNRIASLDE